MKKIIIFGLFFSLLMIIPLHTQAREIDFSAGEEYNSYVDAPNETEKIYKNVFEKVFNFKSNSIPPSQNNPTPTDYPNNPTNPSVTRDPSNNSNLTMYWQTDYTQNLPGGCTIAKAGCGPVSAANIITYLKGTKVNPVDVANKYIAGHTSNYADCRGSTPYGAAYVLSLPEYGFHTEVVFAGKHLTINEAAEQLLDFVDRGSVIHAGGQFYYYDENGDYQENGHFFTILDITKLANGDYDFIGLETAYGDRNNIPISYRTLGRLLYVKHAVAVSR